MHVVKLVTIYIVNNLDQPVSVSVLGNRFISMIGAVKLVGPESVEAGQAYAITLDPRTYGWLPYISLQLKCDVAPTKGRVNAWAIFEDGREFQVVRDLEIRDTNPHDSQSDTDSIRWVRWF